MSDTDELLLSGEVQALYSLSYGRQGYFDCDTFWGSHGCDRAAGHDLPHVCGHPEDDDGLCCIHDGVGVSHLVYGDADGEIKMVDDPRVVDRIMLSETRYEMPTFKMDS